MSDNNLYPTLPLRDIVIFPGMVVPLFVGREKSVRSLEQVIEKNGQVLLITQKDSAVDNPTEDDLFRVGVLGNILQLLKLPDGTVKILVEAQKRVKITKFVNEKSLFQAFVEDIVEEDSESDEANLLMRTAITHFEQYVKMNKRANQDVLVSLQEIVSPSKLADIIASHLLIKIHDRQEILEILNASKRLEKICYCIQLELHLLDTEKKIRSRVKKQMEKTHKDYYLNEQLKAIQKELGNGDDKSELVEIEQQIKKIKLPKEALEKVQSELKKLKLMNTMSAEATVVRSYIDWVLALPWKKNTKIKNDIKLAKKTLDADHYGLTKVKERILEYLAVQQRTKSMEGPILCLVGPPGVGKTSLAKSIAAATGREFIKFSLGGVRDEAEIRGHRRTYLGSMPGKIIQSMKKAKVSNPVFLLDEIDKMGFDFRGDPASALLEVLDPEQNSKFVDHYLEVEYDLSDVMFVATANTMNMPRPLLDRMEVIRLSGYTEDEKVEIAKTHLIPKQLKVHGLKENEWKVSEDALSSIIRYYTREAGVRNLERELANLARKAVKEIIEKEKINTVSISARNLQKYAGVHRFSYGEVEEKDLIGVTTGLAYTEVGGDLLAIESVSLPGKGNIKTTGKLGDVMQESAQAAFSYFKSKSLEFGVIPPKYQSKDIHLHVPEGATPKDGPSAGVAIFTSIVSVMTGIAVKKTVAMTGEITLRGRVLGIGGLKEKLLAALRGGIKTVLIPQENVKDLEEIPSNVKKGLEIIPISSAAEAISLALITMPKPVEWIEIDNVESISTQKQPEDVVTH
ncbi:Lon protease [Rickettsiales bacterium Ac37b]|nr:Lon protease [Rickettsiales bacterium Ac37b]